MTAEEKKKLRRAIGLLNSDYGYEDAMKILHDLHGRMTDRQAEEVEKLSERFSEDMGQLIGEGKEP